MRKNVLVFVACISAMVTLTACGQASASTRDLDDLPTIAEIAPLYAGTEEETEIDSEFNDEEAAISEEIIAPEETEAFDEAVAAEEIASTEENEPAEANSVSEPANIDWHNYMNGDVFDLTAYAEALGYTWIPDPEWEGLAMYAIDRDGIRYFYCYQSDHISLFWEDKDKGCWVISGITYAGEDIYTVKSRGQQDQLTSEETVVALASSISHLASDNPLDIIRIFIPDTGTYDLEKRAGAATYYPNGMINQRAFGEELEIYAVKPWDNYGVIQTK